MMDAEDKVELLPPPSVKITMVPSTRAHRAGGNLGQAIVIVTGAES